MDPSRLRLTLIFAVLLLGRPVLWGHPHELKLEPAQVAYVAGEEVLISISKESWAGAEEGELLLRLSHLKVNVIRLTASYQKPLGTLKLTLPHLPGARAWLELRVGSGGREWIAARSPEFLILAQKRRPLVTLTWRQGEWWVAPNPAWEKGFEDNVQALRELERPQGLLAFTRAQEGIPSPALKPSSQARTTKARPTQCSRNNPAFWRGKVKLPLRE